MARFVRRVRIDAPADEVFRWHERPGAFERLTPPWESVEVVRRHGGIENGARVELRMQQGPLRMRWIAEHCDYDRGRQFRDVQVDGPFARWVHTHRVIPDGTESCYLEDDIEYELPLAPLGGLVGGAFVRARLRRLFDYRHRVTVEDIAAHRRRGGDKAMQIAISGSTGLVGKALVPFLTGAGHRVLRLVRSRPRRQSDSIFWNPASGEIEAQALQGVDAVVHLAGDNIAGGRWTPAKKKSIRDSRVDGTRLLAETLAELPRKPRTLVCASAIGFYGDRGDEEVDETAAAGDGFLADVCRAWEEAAAPARDAGIRVVNLRIGVVLSPKGGALGSMLTPFRLGFGGVVGSGAQYVSWVALDDVVGAMQHALETDSLRGPVNVVAPRPVTNRELTKILGRVLSRPTVLPVPAFALRLALGEMADELLLSSTRVRPRRLQESGYVFRLPDLEEALRYLLGR